jgi:hypothetical protein
MVLMKLEVVGIDDAGLIRHSVNWWIEVGEASVEC